MGIYWITGVVYLRWDADERMLNYGGMCGNDELEPSVYWEVGISRELGIDLRTIVIMANGRFLSLLVLLCNMGQCDEYFELGCHLS